MFVFVDFSVHFLILYGVPEAREVSKNLPGAHSSVLTEYEPISWHGDPIRAQYYHFCVRPGGGRGAAGQRRAAGGRPGAGRPGRWPGEGGKGRRGAIIFKNAGSAGTCRRDLGGKGTIIDEAVRFFSKWDSSGPSPGKILSEHIGVSSTREATF